MSSPKGSKGMKMIPVLKHKSLLGLLNTTQTQQVPQLHSSVEQMRTSLSVN